MTSKFNLAVLAAISIAFSLVPVALADKTGTPHREPSVSKKKAPALSGSKSKLKKTAAKKRIAKTPKPHVMTPGMKM